MPTAREVALTQLGQLAGGVAEVRTYARLNRQPAKVTLMVRTDDVSPVDQFRDYRMSLILLGTKLVTDDDTKGGVDDELDDTLELVLDALDKGPTDLIWLSAKRGTYEATNSPCYLIAVQLVGTYSKEVTP